MRTKFFCTNFLNTARGPGHPGKIPGTSRIPLFETQGRQSFEGGHEVFGHHPFAWKTPTPPGGLRTQKLNLCALSSCLNQDCQLNPSRRCGLLFWGQRSMISRTPAPCFSCCLRMYVQSAPAQDTMRAGINTCRVPGDFLTYMYSHEFRIHQPRCFHICLFVSVTTQISAKSASYVHLIQIHGAQKSSRVWMCIEFVIQVIKQKNAHVYFPVGMVADVPKQEHDPWLHTWCPLWGRNVKRTSFGNCEGRAVQRGGSSAC